MKKLIFSFLFFFGFSAGFAASSEKEVDLAVSDNLKAIYQQEKPEVLKVLRKFRIDLESVLVKELSRGNCGDEADKNIFIVIEFSKEAELQNNKMKKQDLVMFCGSELMTIHFIDSKSTFAMDGLTCEGNIQIAQNKICSCSLVKDFKYKKNLIKAPAKVYFDEGKLTVFISKNSWKTNGVQVKANHWYSPDEKTGKLVPSDEPPEWCFRSKNKNQ